MSSALNLGMLMLQNEDQKKQNNDEKKRPTVRRPKYRIAELIIGLNADVDLTDEQKVWRDTPAMGREVW